MIQRQKDRRAGRNGRDPLGRTIFYLPLKYHRESVVKRKYAQSAKAQLRVFAEYYGVCDIKNYPRAQCEKRIFVCTANQIEQERQWLKPQVWIGPAILSAIMLVVIVYAILGVNDQGIDGTPISAKAVGITLFGPYVLAVELASMLLLAGLVVAFHVGREERAGEVLSNRKDDSAKRKTEEHA